jgi:hypothetical protein
MFSTELPEIRVKPEYIKIFHTLESMTRIWAFEPVTATIFGIGCLLCQGYALRLILSLGWYG